MSPQLKLQRRDDPLAVSGSQEPAEPSSGGERTATPAQPPEVTPRASRTQPQRRRTSTHATASAGAPTSRTPPSAGETATYDDDRLEQTGWRIYESLVAAVRDRAQELTDAGVPTSAAALAAATLHSRLPRTVEEGTEVMRVYRQAGAGRARARRGG